MKNYKVNHKEIKVGSILLTWFGDKVEVLEVSTDPKKKPLTVSNGHRTQFFHFYQIEKIFN